MEDGSNPLLHLEGGPLDRLVLVGRAALGQRLLKQRQHRLEPGSQVGRLQQPRRQPELCCRPHDLADEQRDLGRIRRGWVGKHPLRELQQHRKGRVHDAVQRLALLVALELIRLAKHTQAVQGAV